MLNKINSLNTSESEVSLDADDLSAPKLLSVVPVELEDNSNETLDADDFSAPKLLSVVPIEL